MSASWLRQLYIQVMIGIVVGAALGFIWPSFAVTLQPLADGLIKLTKMLLAPVIFATVVLGIAKMGDIKEVGRIGVRAIPYFEVAPTLALVIGLVVVNLIGNGIATIAIARWDNALDLDRVQQVIREQRGEIASAITAAARTTDAVTTQG